MKSSTKQTTEQSNKLIWKSIIISGIIGIGIALILLLVFSFVLSSNNLPEVAPNILSVVALAVGALSSGVMIAKKHRKRGAVLGFLVGIFIFAFVLIGGLISFGFIFSNLIIIKFLFVVLSSTVGGIIGVNTKKKLKI